MMLNFILIDNINEPDISLFSENVEPELKNFLVDRIGITTENIQPMNDHDYKLIPLKDEGMAYCYNEYDSEISKERVIQLSWIIFLKPQDFVNLGKDLSLFQEEIIPSLKKHVFENFEVSNQENLMKKIKKSRKKLPILIPKLNVENSTLQAKANEHFLELREKLQAEKNLLKDLANVLLKNSRVVISIHEEDNDKTKVDEFINFLYLILPTRILFTICYYQQAKSGSLNDDLINLSKITINTELEEDLDFKVNLVNKNFCLVELSKDKLNVSKNQKNGQRISDVSNFLIELAYDVLNLQTISQLDLLFHDYETNWITKRDVDYFISFLKDFEQEIEDISKIFQENKTQVILLYSTFNAEKRKLDFLQNNKGVLERLNKIYYEYQPKSTQCKQILDNIVDELSLEVIDDLHAKEFEEMISIIQTLKNNPLDSLKNLVSDILTNLKLPDWLIELKKLDIAEKSSKLLGEMDQIKEKELFTEEIKEDPGLKVKLKTILTDDMLETIKKYADMDDDFYYGLIYQYISNGIDPFMLIILNVDEFLIKLKEISVGLLLHLEKAQRTNDYLRFLQTGVWYYILHLDCEPSIYWDENISSNISNLHDSIIYDKNAEAMLNYGWQVPTLFRELFIKVLDDSFIETFNSFIEAFGNIYERSSKELEKVRKNNAIENIIQAFEKLVAKDVDEDTELQIKVRQYLEKVQEWHDEFNPPNDVFNILKEIIETKNEEKINAVLDYIDNLDKLMLEHADFLNSEDFMNKLRECLANDGKLQKEMEKINMIKKLRVSGSLNLLNTLQNMDNNELSKEVISFIKTGDYSDFIKLALKHLKLFERIQKDREESYSLGFKDDPFAEAFNSYLETKKPFHGLLELLNYSKEIEEIIKLKG